MTQIPEASAAEIGERPARPRRGPAAAPAPAPFAAWYPWADKKGRPSLYRGVVFALLVLPAAVLFAQYMLGTLGARPLTAVLHGAGDWAIWILLLSLVVTPARAVLAAPNAVVVRRMVGLGALAYACAHLLLYMADQNWRLLTVAREIAVRFYLLIGFTALLGLAVLGWTSRDTWVRRLGPAWKRLHKLAYALAALGVLHFFLQSKADVSRAALAAGVFAWCMLWRLLPAGRDRSPLVLAGLAVAAAAAALGMEWGWYRFVTHANAWRVVQGEFDVTFGPRPAGQTLVLGLLVAAIAQGRALALGHPGRPWVSALAYAGGAAVADIAVWTLNLGTLNPGMPNLGMEDLGPLPGWAASAVWLALLGLLGLVRGWLAAGDADMSAVRWLDGAWLLCVLLPVAALGSDDPGLALGGNAVLAAALLVLAVRLVPRSRRGAAVAAVLIGWVAYATVAAGLLPGGAA